MNNHKLLGIELCRGLATYAVILVHSGDENWGIAIDPISIAFRLCFYFSVPFFLAAAFYFLVAKPEVAYSPKFWHSRIERIVIPYVIWSTIFLIFRVVVFKLSHQTDRLQTLLSDPLSIVFFGGASYHLYFLPLLLAGTSLVLLLPLLSKSAINNFGLGLLLVVSIALYWFLDASGNTFQLGPNIAFANSLMSWQIDLQSQPLLRAIGVELAWIFKCLPYFFGSLILRNILHKSQVTNRISTIQLLALFTSVDIFGRWLLPGVLQEFLLAYILLFAGISISEHLKNPQVNKIIANLGACSFGIYLIHPFIMNFVKSIISKISPELTTSISITSILALSIPCFAISWVLVAYLLGRQVAAKQLFGISNT
jgi:peptidoglycan/LPS O-acetylase OafA/YrhL